MANFFRSFSIVPFPDHKNLCVELLAKAVELSKELKQETTAIILGKADDSLAKEYISYGADKVIIVETDFEAFKAEEFADILKQLIVDNKEEVILIGSSKHGKEIASRLAGLLHCGCVIDATDVYLKENMVTVNRVVYSGNAISVQQFKILYLVRFLLMEI